MRAAFYTLGCKVNQYETQILEQMFYGGGYDIVPTDSPADVFVINSCTVTSSGDKKTRQALRHFKRANPGSVAVLTGCFPQAFPQEAAKITEADVITGSYNRSGLLHDIESFLQTGSRVINITPHERGEKFESMTASRFLDRTRAFVKIQDGCERFCTYCIIPMARGPRRSKPLDELYDELTGLASAGYKEAVLVGINLPSYGTEGGSVRLIDAIELACGVSGIERVRLGSLEPEVLTDDDIARMAAQQKFCPQFHLSLQSGCDATLKRMNRHYSSAQYGEMVQKLRSAFNNCSITTDIMVGFPNETDEEFESSLAFAKNIGFAKVHVFPYSIRKGTRAASMTGQQSRAVKEKRAAVMLAAMAESRKSFLHTQLGKTEEVLFETITTALGTEGYTKNYTPVRVLSQKNISGCLYPVRLLAVSGEYCIGELVEPNLI
ncbi:MAG: tRNA (N(6)-L-threonylcarbamoyladenosine(37)-C(2))-methylthiotransferase MtaB [Hydrogenoanaerobacterium sp.]